MREFSHMKAVNKRLTFVKVRRMFRKCDHIRLVFFIEM